MLIDLSSLTFDSRDVKNLVNLFNRFTSYKNFNYDQECQVYCNSEFVFLGFESIVYNLGYTSHYHKMSEIISSPYKVSPVPFSILYRLILSLASDNNN